MAANPLSTSTPILIIGAGPVGLSLAIELRLHSIPVTVLDCTPTIDDGHPKGRANDMRTVEHYRRWGISDEIRELAWKTANPRQELVITQSLLEEPIGNFLLRLGRDPLESKNLAAEPSFSVPQPVLMRVLERKAREIGALVFRGWEAADVVEDGAQVVTTVRAPDGASQTITSSYVIGADGPVSLVRRKAGIEQGGTGPLGRTWTYVVRSEGHPISNLISGEKYSALGMLMVANAEANSILSIPGDDEWGFGILRTGTDQSKLEEPSDDEVKIYARNLLGTSANIEILSRSSYASMTRLSNQYRRGRLFIAGDACHICPPTGGHNMNTGIEDAVNLAWKLAAVLSGWGGEDLLESYEAERRPVGGRVSGVAMANSLAMQEADTFLNADGKDDVEVSGAEKAQAIYDRTYTQWNSYGVVLDQRYDSSPVIIQDSWNDAPAWNPSEYWPHARPGHRAPHLWLDDGRALRDAFGKWFTLLAIGARGDVVEKFVAAANRSHFPVEVLEVGVEIAREKYPASLTLVRPDGYVAWQGEADECNPVDVIRRVSGHDPAGPRLRDPKL
ncbi:FAD binding domain-containing protein [Aspergillus keveii]|uniref:FAD binding domain-containing protein n=1 Tax=Aspergillus keveii TaxID=714993 RepID=A0ABR4FXL5_9EURO